MKRLVYTAIIFSLLSFSHAQKVAIVANPEIRNISKEDIKEILLGIRRNLNGSSNPRIILSKDNKVNRKAIEKLLGISYENFKVYWFEKALAGEGNIPRELDHRRAINEIKKHKGTLGILPAEKVRSSGLKVLMVFE